MKVIDYIVLVLVAVGTINWGLVGILNFDLVKVLFGDMTVLSRIIYTLVGVCGLVNIGILFNHIEPTK